MITKQEYPDLYFRVVERRLNGIVVRGAKSHQTIFNKVLLTN
ncbi:MAG TPA: hypothetical protein VIM42_02960 [Clostridium sp.]